MRSLSLSAALLWLVAAPAFSAATEDAEKVVREGLDDVVAVCMQSQGGKAMADKLQPVLEPRVSFESMTRRAVGPGWRQFTPEQQAEATRLFTKLIIRNYSNKFTPGEKPETRFLKAVSPAPDKIEIPTTMLYKGSRYSISYRLEHRGGKWLVTDILAEGVSLIANYRAQFDDIFKKSGATAVMASLRQSVEK